MMNGQVPHPGSAGTNAVNPPSGLAQSLPAAGRLCASRSFGGLNGEGN
jgi:hypothetical protein